METSLSDIVAVREAILYLLRQQVEALNSPLLTDAQLRDCYERQARVQELRERLQATANAEGAPSFVPPGAVPASADSAGL